MYVAHCFKGYSSSVTIVMYVAHSFKGYSSSVTIVMYVAHCFKGYSSSGTIVMYVAHCFKGYSSSVTSYVKCLQSCKQKTYENELRSISIWLCVMHVPELI